MKFFLFFVFSVFCSSVALTSEQEDKQQNSLSKAAVEHDPSVSQDLGLEEIKLIAQVFAKKIIEKHGENTCGLRYKKDAFLD